MVVAYRQELVKRVDDRRVGQDGAHEGDEVVAKEERVLEVNDVGVVCAEKVGVVLRVDRLDPKAQPEEVELLGLGEEEVLMLVAVDQAEGCAGMTGPLCRDR